MRGRPRHRSPCLPVFFRAFPQEPPHLLRRRWQPGEIEAHTADQRVAIRLRLRLEPARGERAFDERIDPRSIHRLQRDEGPVLLILRALGDPFPERLDLRRRERAEFRFRGRHVIVFLRRENARDHFAFLRMSRHDRAVLHSDLAHIEPQVSFALFRVGSVAVKAFVREDRPHVAIEFHRARVRRGQDGKHGAENRNVLREESHWSAVDSIIRKVAHRARADDHPEIGSCLGSISPGAVGAQRFQPAGPAAVLAARWPVTEN